jgi:MYXO-CTERM domain-containing protein
VRHLGVCLLFGAALAFGWAAPAFAQAGGPELKTDDPYFPGEGALSTPAKVIQHANAVPRGTVGTGTDREKLIRLFLWRAEHYTHLVSPAVYNLPGLTPSPSSDNGLMTDYDGMRTFFSYGWGVCGTNHAQMRVFADEAGWASRRRGLNGDTGYEILVDGGWRYCNTDQYTLHYLSNSGTAHFASLDQVVNTNHHYAEWNPDPGLGHKLPQANTHSNYQDFAGVTGTVPCRSLQWRSYYTGVWIPIAGGNNKMYGEGYTATPVVVRLRRGETFTRWQGPDGVTTDLAVPGRMWWGYNGGDVYGGGDNSPYSKYSFVNNAPARDQTVIAAPEESAKVGQRYGNGCFLWQPSLSANEHLDGTLETTGTLVTGGSPALKATSAATLVLFQNTPYTIAGRPSDAMDPATAGATEGAVISADAVGTVGVELSTNAGATWSSIGSLSGAGAKIDFTDQVKGRNQYLLRLSFDSGEGLNSLTLRTITVMNQAVYPNLKSGSSQVTYTASNSGALELSPDLWTSASANSTTGYVQKSGDSGNLNAEFYLPAGNTFGYEGTNNSPISITYKISIPPALAAAGATWKQIFAAGDYKVAIPPDVTGHFGRIEVSPDGTTWTKIGEHLPPTDNDLSHFWTYGRSADGTTLGGTTYYVKFSTQNGTHPAGIRHLRLNATYTVPASSAPVEVTYGWNNGAAQTNVHTVAAGSGTDTWSITTGTVASQTKVALRIASNVATPTAPSISIPPADRTVTAGQTATFSVSANGTAPLTYQWRKNGTNIAGATSSSYTTPATVIGDNGSTFDVIVSNGQGSVTSNVAHLTVNAAPPGGGSTTVTLQTGLNGYVGTTDTYIDRWTDSGGVGNGVFSNSDRLEIRWYPSDGSQETMDTLIKFNLSSIPAGATITSAKLTLYNTRANVNDAADVLVLGKVTSAWDDSWTWNKGVPTTVASGVTCPSVAGLTLAPATPELYVITGMGPLVQGWVNTPASNFGIMFSCATTLNLRFASSEYATPQYRPALEIVYTTGGAPPVDTTPPTLSITPPPSSATSSPLTVTGTASDAGGVSQVTWSNALTGQSGTATGTTNWTADIPLANGNNVITITVTDAAGNPTSQTFSVTYTGPTPPPPAPTPAAPTSGGGKSHKRCGVGTTSAQPLSPALVALAALLLALALRRQ